MEIGPTRLLSAGYSYLVLLVSVAPCSQRTKLLPKNGGTVPCALSGGGDSFRPKSGEKHAKNEEHPNISKRTPVVPGSNVTPKTYHSQRALPNNSSRLQTRHERAWIYFPRFDSLILISPAPAPPSPITAPRPSSTGTPHAAPRPRRHGPRTRRPGRLATHAGGELGGLDLRCRCPAAPRRGHLGSVGLRAAGGGGGGMALSETC